MYTVGDIIKDLPREVVFIGPKSRVLTALRIMRKKDIGSILVKSKGVFVGIFTERDNARKVELEGWTAAETPVREVMTLADDIITVNPATTIEECSVLIYNHHVRHLPVMRGDQVIAVISVRDIAKASNEYQIYLAAEYSNYMTGRT